MRFIGGKSLMLDRIDQVIKDNSSETISIVGDLFCGSGVVSQHFKKQGKKVISNDIMYMSYVLARGLTELNSCPTFGELQIKDIFKYLNNLSEPLFLDKAFIYNNYSPNDNCERMYFQPKNAKKIDAIRQQINSWFIEKKLSETEYFYLLACLLSAVPYVSNIAGVYAAYLKHWDKRTYNDLYITPIEIIESNVSCRAFNMDAIDLCKSHNFDLVYIDPPYNQREYISNYHILETIAKYDSPVIKGVTGMRPYNKSAFCSKSTVKNAFYSLFYQLKTKYAIVSYNNEGLLTTEELFSIFNEFGKVKLYEYPYRRYKSKIPNNKKGLKEQLFFISFGD